MRLDETGGRAFWWFVNGKRLSLRGANGFPTQYYSKITPAYLADYFGTIKDHNLDVLIIHDHQAPPAVYDVADREGVVILQNFTLIWEVNVCDFVRPNGDPALTNNAAVMARMATEAIWPLYNHPSIFWWSMHDESGHSAIGGRPLLHGNFCRQGHYRPGEKFPVYQDPSLNLDLDNQLIRVARAQNQLIPMHRTGGLETDSVTWHGWYKACYFDLLNDPEVFPLEFGGEAVSYAMAKIMTYQPGLWPIRDETADLEWRYHALQTQVMESHVGRTTAYGSFNEWAFASQLHQAVVIKYHVEINRQNMYAPTGSVIQYMYNDWWPSVNFGVTDWDLEPKLALDWMGSAFTPQLAATRVGRNIYSSGEAAELPLHLVNDQHLDFPQARLSWRLVEETDGFVIKGHATGGTTLANATNPMAALKSSLSAPVVATIGHQVPVATVLQGFTVIDLPADASVPAGVALFEAPQVTGPRHYTLYLTLTDASGKVLSLNWDHFMVVENAKRFDPPEGISPAPRFDLSLALSREGSPLVGPVEVVDKYDANNRRPAELDQDGRADLAGILPGAYRIIAGGLTYEFLLNRNETVTVDFRPGLKTTLGTAPIIDWGHELQRPRDEDMVRPPVHVGTAWRDR